MRSKLSGPSLFGFWMTDRLPEAISSNPNTYWACQYWEWICVILGRED